MTELVTPDVRWYHSWAAALGEFGEEYPYGSGCDPEGQPLDREAFAAFVADRLRHADERVELPERLVHCSYFWIADGEELVGFLALRHRLNTSCSTRAATSASRCAPPADARGTLHAR